jgi:hypothetical protein
MNDHAARASRNQASIHRRLNHAIHAVPRNADARPGHVGFFGWLLWWSSASILALALKAWQSQEIALSGTVSAFPVSAPCWPARARALTGVTRHSAPSFRAMLTNGLAAVASISSAA